MWRGAAEFSGRTVMRAGVWPTIRSTELRTGHVALTRLVPLTGS